MANEKDRTNEELAGLQLEESRFRIQELRNIAATREVRRSSIQRSLRNQVQRRLQTEAGCAHRKGGKGSESLFRGNDANYAVVKHTLPHGVTIVVCQRCPKVWAPPPPELIARGATSEDRKLYARLFAEYETALNFPTDNQPSGSQLFVISGVMERPQAIAS
jgi:hypothetical protein